MNEPIRRKLPNENQSLFTIAEVGAIFENAFTEAVGARYQDFMGASDPKDVAIIHAECRAIAALKAELYGILQNMILDAQAKDQNG